MAETVPPPIPPPIPPPVPPPVPPATPRVVPPPLPPSELRLDREHPWPGLISFTEADHAFFFGREREVAELARVIRQKTVTVFFGKSGLGKSSILRAGVSPLLRQSEFIPIYIRLNHAEAAPPLEDQVEIAIEDVFAQEQIEGPKPIRCESLWEYFHKKESDWWDPDNRLVKPVLIFDQFEELLTLGQSTPGRAARSAAFLSELEDLVENRPPAALQERFEAERGLARNYDLERVDYRVVLTLREDFLPDLEGLRERLRAIMFNRVRLLPMSGDQAMDVVLKPGRDLVDEDVAIRIADFVSSSERSRLQAHVTRAQLAKRSIEPALLSVVLQELNNRRIQAGQDKITAELVGKTNPTEIFHDFYLRGLAGMDGAVREFIEDSLLTSSGARNRIAEEDALTKRAISSEIISKLIDRRIVQRETTGNTKWLELTHDTLADVVRTDRTEHHQQRELELVKASEKEARARLRRSQKLVAAFAVLLVIAAAFLWLLTIRVEEQAYGTLTALKKELDAPAPGAPDRVKPAIDRLSEDASHFFFLRRLKLAYGQALAYGAEICYFNGCLEDGCRYSRDAVRTLSNVGSDSTTAVSRAHADYARAQGELKKGQLRAAEEDFRSVIKLTESAPQSGPNHEERNRLHLFAELGLGEVKSAQDLRGEAEKLFNQARTELKSVFPDQSSQRDVIEAAIYETSALKGLGIISERNGRMSDQGWEDASATEDFLEQADTKISKTAEKYPDNVALRTAQVDTVYWRVFFLTVSRTNSSYAAAATRLRDALTKCDNLANLDQQNRNWKFLLAQDYRAQGMLLQAVHENTGAFEAFAKMRELAAEVQRSEPSWFMNNYYLTIAEYYMADRLVALSTSDDLHTFQERLAKVSGHDSSDFGKATIALSNTIAEINKSGALESQQKRSAAAIADYQSGIYRHVRQQLEKLLQEAPGNAEHERTKALMISSTGTQEANRGHFAAAVTAHREALDTINRMPAEITQLPDFKDSAASITQSLGDALVQTGGEENAKLALKCRSKALQIREDLVKSKATVNNVASCANAYIAVGDSYRVQGNKEKAQEFYERAIHVYERALESAQRNSGATAINGSWRRTELLRSKAYAFNYIAYQWRNAGDFASALAMLRQAIQSANDAFKIDPLDAETISFLNDVKGDENNPKWSKFCKEKLQEAQLSDGDRVQLRSIADLLEHMLPPVVSETSVSGESLNWGILPLIPGSWRNLGPKEQENEIRYLAGSEIQPSIDIALVSRIRTLGLPCYPDTNLYEVELKKPNAEPIFLNYIRHGDVHGRLRDFSSVDREKARAIWLNHDEQVDGVRLDGTATPIQIFNSRHHPILENEVSATLYLRLFCTAIQGPGGTFHIIDSQGDLHWQPNVKDTIRQEVERRVYPLRISATATGWNAKATIAYSNSLSYDLLQLSTDGNVQIPLEDLVANSLLQEKNSAARAAIQNKKWEEAVMYQKSVIDLFKEGLPIVPEKFDNGFRTVSQAHKEEQKSAQNKAILAGLYGGLSWCQLHTRDFLVALESTDAGLKLGPTDVSLQTNHAHALLFLRRTAEAERLYRAKIGQIVDLNDKKQTWEQVVLNDFDQLEKDGITSPEFARIRGILKSAEH